MAAHVVVIDSTARSVKIRTTPGKHLTDILEESCVKMGRDTNLYGLKHKNKTLDLSRTVTLSGLLPGARLELVAASRSPSVVSVALQLPQAEPDGTTRLTDKFPSTTTLWLILRKFESNAGAGRNFTARSTALDKGQTSGSGRIYFQTPVVTTMNRELASFTDLQKSLAQLGVNGGSILLRLTFRQTETPLEEAMMQIEQYFQDFKPHEEPKAAKRGLEDKISTTLPEIAVPVFSEGDSLVPEPQLKQNASENSQSDINDKINREREGFDDDKPLLNPKKIVHTVTGPSERPIAVFLPPSSDTPKAALQKDTDDDYEPTLDHVKSHQQHLQANSKNKTLKSDAQIAAENAAKAQKVSQIKEVEIKLRFPDQTQVSATFDYQDTARTLYEHTRALMRYPNEPVSLTFPGAKGRQTVPLDSEIELIRGLGLVGRVLVEVAWGDAANSKAKQESILKDEFVAKAQKIPTMVVEESAIEQKSANIRMELPGAAKEAGKGGMPKWFKGIGKK